MRLLLILVLWCISSCAYSACSTTVSGSSRFTTINISDGGCRTEVEMLSFTIKAIGAKKAQSGSFKFTDECTETKDGFFCRKNGRTPLAGTTYKRTLDGRPICNNETVEYRFTCVAGCNRLAPKYLDILPWEC